jgi:hypothetical protein
MKLYEHMAVDGLYMGMKIKMNILIRVKGCIRFDKIRGEEREKDLNRKHDYRENR